MTILVRYFGLLGERRGLTEEKVSSNADTVGKLYAEIAANYPLEIDQQHLRVAVNDRFTHWDHVLNDGDQVAFLPPMSGG